VFERKTDTKQNAETPNNSTDGKSTELETNTRATSGASKMKLSEIGKQKQVKAKPKAAAKKAEEA
jgi:hypothetical protein